MKRGKVDVDFCLSGGKSKYLWWWNKINTRDKDDEDADEDEKKRWNWNGETKVFGDFFLFTIRTVWGFLWREIKWEDDVDTIDEDEDEKDDKRENDKCT